MPFSTQRIGLRLYARGDVRHGGDKHGMLAAVEESVLPAVFVEPVVERLTIDACFLDALAPEAASRRQHMPVLVHEGDVALDGVVVG